MLLAHTPTCQGRGTARIVFDSATTSCHYCPNSAATYTRHFKGVSVGTAGKRVFLNQIWTHPVFGEGLYNPNLPCDLIPWSVLNDLFHVTLKDETFLLGAREGSATGDWIATIEGKLFTLRPTAPTAITPIPVPTALAPLPIALAAVSHPKRDKNVWLFHEVMAHAPTETLVHMANQPEHSSWKLSPKRIRAQRLEDCPHCTRSKTTARVPRDTTLPTEDRPKDEPGTIIHMDLASFTFDTKQRFVLVAKEASTGFIFAKLLERKTREEVLTAVLEIKGYLLSLGHTLSSIHCDSEAVFKSIELQMRKLGVAMVFVPPDVHERVSERAIRTLKSWLRANLDALPYKLPAHLFRYLLAHVVRVLNNTPNKRSGTLSPRRALDPKFRISRKLTTKVVFGSKALAHQAPNNNMDMPMLPVLYLGHASSAGNAGFQCLDLRTRRLVVMNKIKPLPIDDNSIAQDIKRMFGVGTNVDFEEESPQIQEPMVATAAPPVPVPPLVIVTAPRNPTSTNAASPAPAVQTEPSSAQGSPQQAAISPPSSPPLPSLPEDEEGDFPDAASTALPQEATPAPAPQPAPVPPPGKRFNAHGRIVNSLAVASAMQRGVQPNVTVASSATARAIQRGGPSIPVTPSRQQGLVRSGNRLAPAAAAAQPDEHAFIASTMRSGQITKDLRNASQIREFTKFIENDVFTAVGEVADEVLPTHAFGKTIHDTHGIPVDYKTRLVISGDKQRFGLPDDVGANTPNIELAMMLFQMCVSLGLSAKTMDVTSAFHHSEAPRPMYARLDATVAKVFCEINPAFSKFLRRDGKLNVQLNKAAYGLKEGPLEFQKYTTTKLAEQGFEPCESARCLYVKRLPCGRLHYMLCYVDDFLSIAPRDAHDVSFMARCYKAYTVNEGPVLEYLGLRAEFGENRVFVSQPGYVEKILEEAGANELTPSPLPYQANLFDVDQESPQLKPKEASRFVTVTMMINYLATRTRPDVKLATAYLTTRLREPTQADWTKLIKVVRYLKGTVGMGLTFHASNTTLSCQADASHGLHRDGRGQLGFCLWLGSKASAPFMTLCKRADAAATSSTHAEALALYRAALDLTPLIWLMEQLGFKQQDPVMVGQDNQSLTRIVQRGPGWGGKSRHFELKFWWIKDLEDAGLLKLHYVKSEDQVPDGFTKPLDGKRFTAWREMVLGKPHKEYTSYKDALTGKSNK